MKLYKIYIFENEEFRFLKSTPFAAQLNEILGKKEDEHYFFRVDNLNIREHGEDKGTESLVSSYIYLNNYKVCSRGRICTVDDINREKKKLTTLYKVDGTVVYYPCIPLSIPDIKEILNLSDDEWATEKCVKDRPDRYVVLFYDWESYNITKKKVLNRKATNRFKTELYGDVLFVNENFIA